jgi:hypothetical protein
LFYARLSVSLCHRKCSICKTEVFNGGRGYHEINIKEQNYEKNNHDGYRFDEYDGGNGTDRNAIPVGTKSD